MRPLALALLALFASPAQAALVRDCNTPIASARNLARPYAEATRTFANGDIAFLSLLQDEPACCGAHLMVVYIVPDQPFSLCRIVTSDDQSGWSRLDLARAQAAYDPAHGLTLAFPASRYDGSGPVPFTLRVTVNRATGGVQAQD